MNRQELEKKLSFSKSNNPHIEKTYATHFVSSKLKKQKEVSVKEVSNSSSEDSAAFLLAEIEAIHNPEMYQEYVEKAGAIIKNHGGQYVLKSEKLFPVSGDWGAKRIILIKFKNRDQLNRCFQSDEYKKVAPLREQSVTSKGMIIED